MRSGRLRHVVSIQVQEEAQDSFGALVDTWVDYAKRVPASIKPVSSADRYSGQVTSGQVTHEIKIRYLAGVTSDMRILYGDRVFDIAAPPMNWQEMNWELTILCVERL